MSWMTKLPASAALFASAAVVGATRPGGWPHGSDLDSDERRGSEKGWRLEHAADFVIELLDQIDKAPPGALDGSVLRGGPGLVGLCRPGACETPPQ